MTVSRFALIFACLVGLAASQVKDKNSNTCVSPTSSSSSKTGNYAGICVDKAVFSNQDYAFNFKSAYVRSTTFTETRFADAGSTNVNLTFAFWENVRFVNCHFEGANIIFAQALLTNVVFESCVFKSTPRFNEITFSNVTFKGCTFESGATFQHADISTLGMTNSKVQGGETLFDRTTMRGSSFTGTTFGSVRFQYLNAEGITFQGVYMDQLNCHEPLSSGQFVTKRAEFNSTSFLGCSLVKVACDQTIWRTPLFDQTNFGAGVMDFSRSNMSNVKLTSLGSIQSGTCAQLNFQNSLIKSGTISNITTCKLDLTSVNASGTDISGLDHTGSTPTLKNTIFNKTKFANGQCCTSVCEKYNCICNVPAVTTDGCQPGSRSVNPNVKGSCFPASATVTLESGANKRMDELEVGDRVMSGRGIYSGVYMFTHRQPSAEVVFLSLDTAAGVSLTLTSGHYIYLDGELAPASDAVARSSHVQLADGRRTLVTNVRFTKGRGLFNPQTMHGDIVVNGVVASTYTTALAPVFAHSILAPLRALYDVVGAKAAGMLEDLRVQTAAQL